MILHASMLVAASVPRFVVHGSRASWVKYGSDPQEFRLAAEMGVDLGAAPAAESAAVIDGTTHAQTATLIPRGDYRHFYAALRDAVAGDASIPVPAAEAIATVAVVQTAAQSSAERRALPLRLADEERRALARSVPQIGRRFAAGPI